MGENKTERITPKTIFATLISIAGVIGLVYGFNTFIDKKIASKMNDPEFVRQIATHVRPSVIFNSKGTILIDMGAMQYLDSISVEPTSVADLPNKIVVKPKQYMSHAPLLTLVDPISTVVEETRGAGITWVYTFKQWMRSVTEELDTVRFRLEIIP